MNEKQKAARQPGQAESRTHTNPIGTLPPKHSAASSSPDASPLPRPPRPHFEDERGSPFISEAELNADKPPPAPGPSPFDEALKELGRQHRAQHADTSAEEDTAAHEDSDPSKGSDSRGGTNDDGNGGGGNTGGTTNNDADRNEERMRPGISNAFVRAAGVRHVDAGEAKRSCGFEAAGLAIPFFNLDGTQKIVNGKPFYRLRLDAPIRGMKYYQAGETGVQVYVAPDVRLHLQPHVDLSVVESEFKSLAMNEAKIPAVGITGFFGFAVAGGETLVPELAELIMTWKPGRLHFVGDNDTALNPDFALAAVRFQQFVAPVPVILPRIPLRGPGKGVDDCREALGLGFDAWWADLVRNAIPVGRGPDPDTISLALIARETEVLKTWPADDRPTLVRKLVHIGQRVQRSPICFEQLTVLVKECLGITPRAFKAEVAKQNKADAKERQQGHADAMKHLENDPSYMELCRLEGSPCFLSNGRNGLQIQLNAPWHARKFTMEHRVLFEGDEGRFYSYTETNGLWEVTSKYGIKELASQDLRQFGEEVAGLRGEPALAEQVQILRSHRFLDDLTQLIKGKAEKTKVFVRHHHLLHLANCMLDLDPEPPEIVTFSPDFMSRNQIPIAFDQNAGPPARFLKELLGLALPPEDIGLLQRWLGSVLLGGNSLQHVLILVGTAGGGKGTLVEVLTGVVGKANIAELRTKQLDQRFEIGRYAGKTLLAGCDVPGDFLQHPGAQRILSLVGHDPLDGEHKNLNGPVPIKGDFAVVITCNSRLSVRLDGNVDAWARRLLIVPYERPKTEKPVPDLATQLLRDEGPEILNWIVQGARWHLAEMREHGKYILTPAQQLRVEKLLAESDSLRTFVHTKIRNADRRDLTVNEICQAFVDWCNVNGWQAPAERIVENRLADRRDRGQTVRVSQPGGLVANIREDVRPPLFSYGVAADPSPEPWAVGPQPRSVTLEKPA